jgi:Na+-driven multidrug efflux pump
MNKTIKEGSKQEDNKQDAKKPSLFDGQADPSYLYMLLTFFELQSIILVSNLAFYFVLATDQIMVGHLGNTDKIAGIGISTATLNLFSLGVSMGINKAMDVLCSQAIGSGDLVLCGHVLNRGRFIAFAFIVPISLLLYIFAEQVTLIFSRDENVVFYGANYLRLMLPAMFIHGQLDLVRRWLVRM